jgi:D-alanyl-D-alanine carboxypeptidase/D-alanyl-D-alanine-endopeptidase (penicillin-binding protein 4)
MQRTFLRGLRAVAVLWAVPVVGGAAAERGMLAAATDARRPSPDVQRRSHAGLRRALDRLLGQPALRGARVSAQVFDLDRGEVVYERNPGELVNPASVTKVVTAAAALVRLGPEYRYKTAVKASERPSGAIVDGHLFVRGSGDPLLVTERMYKLATNVASAGVRQVRGDLVIDDSFFDKERRGPGWDQDPSDRPYQAPIGAASVNFNAIEVFVYPGARRGLPVRVLTNPETSYVRVDNQAVTAGAGARTRITVRSIDEKGANVLRVTGRIARGHPGYRTWRKIDHPIRYFGTLFRELLAQVGVKVRGRIRAGRAPAGAATLAQVKSPALEVLLRDVNKFSQNFMAEQILKTLGARASGEPGSWKNGARVVEAFLEEVGVPGGTYLYKNGSGLNDVNRFSAAQVVKVLAHMQKRFQVGPEFLASLAVAGADGSVKRRLHTRDVYRRLRVKTGWLRGVSSLAGYVGARGGRLAFALLVNGLRSAAIGHRLQQQVARTLAAFPRVGR